jgi:hypothetical protein
MRVLATVAVLSLGLSACGGGSSANSDGGVNQSQCNQVVNTLCEKTVACSTDHDAGINVFIVEASDAGVGSFGITENQGGQTHCENFIGLACKGSHAAMFTSVCSAVVNGLQCGTDPDYGNGVEIPAVCWNSQ